jgi:hypothetical protein
MGTQDINQFLRDVDWYWWRTIGWLWVIQPLNTGRICLVSGIAICLLRARYTVDGSWILLRGYRMYRLV